MTPDGAAHENSSSMASSNHIHDGHHNQDTISIQSIQSEDEDREVDGDIVGQPQERGWYILC